MARIISPLFLLLAPLLSGVMLFLAFPAYDQAWVAWVALAPLLVAIPCSSLKYDFVSSLVCGMFFFMGIFSWIFEVPQYTIVHHGILALYLGSYVGFFGLVVGFISRRLGVVTALLAAPFVWVSLEYGRSNLSFLALPWGLLAHSQYRYLLVIQFASIAGAYAVTFMIVMANSALALATLACLSREGWQKPRHSDPTSRRIAVGAVFITVVLIGLALLHGWITLSRPLDRKEIKVSVVQGNIAQAKKWDRRFAKFIMETYADLSTVASEDRPALIVWPETATPGFVLKNLALLNKVVTMIRQINTHFLIGSAEYPKFTEAPFNPKEGGNTALFFSPKGKVLGQYLKMRLVPFSEHIPYKGIIPWPDFIVPKEKRNFLIQGKEFTLFDLDGAKFCTPICWEPIFPELIRQFVKTGANFVVNITNEAWFGETAAPYQLVAMSVFRAVENRISVVRCGNSGISCFIDPFGRITGRVQENDKDIFVRGHLTQRVSLSQERTLYTIYGDIFVYLSVTITIFVFALFLLKTRRASLPNVS